MARVAALLVVDMHRKPYCTSLSSQKRRYLIEGVHSVSLSQTRETESETISGRLCSGCFGRSVLCPAGNSTLHPTRVRVWTSFIQPPLKLGKVNLGWTIKVQSTWPRESATMQKREMRSYFDPDEKGSKRHSSVHGAMILIEQLCYLHRWISWGCTTGDRDIMLGLNTSLKLVPSAVSRCEATP